MITDKMIFYKAIDDSYDYRNPRNIKERIV